MFHQDIAVSVCVLCLTAAGVRAGERPIAAVRVASGLALPVFVTHAPGDFDRVFIVEQGGRIRILKGEVLWSEPFLDIASRVVSGGEQGLLGLAFHPNYAENGRFFVNYTAPTGAGQETVIERYQVSVNPDRADVASAQTVLTITQPDRRHNAGWLGFGPDGYLYVATGDGGPPRQPSARAQDITDELLGKMLRIDVDRDDWPDDADKGYGIPADNPFVGVEGDDEIWAYGLRNPWRCAFDSQTGDLFMADVGEERWEEINFIGADSSGGLNFGWQCMEGAECSGFGDCSCVNASMILPVYSYSHNGLCSITGGEVYRGCAIPGLAGSYFFADFCTSQIWSLRYDGVNDPVVVERTAELAPGAGLDIRRISSFGRDAFGELYICDLLDGEVFKIVPAVSPDPVSIIESDPPHGAIDARQPWDPDGGNVAGWRSIRLTFDGCVSGMVADDFVVTQTGGDAAPGVAGATLIGLNSVHVSLDAPITVGVWTTVTHVPSGTSRTIGALPGDVDADGRVDAGDVDSLLNALRDPTQSAPLRSVDIDRSGRISPCDILRAIDLLNGADGYPAFLGATLR